MHGAIAMGVGLILATVGCVDAESEVEPQTPVNAQLADHTEMRGPDIVDGFPQVFGMAQHRAPPPVPVRSVSLGFIGDAPLGTQYTPPHREPYWTRPFPCRWTNSCGYSPFLR